MHIFRSCNKGLTIVPRGNCYLVLQKATFMRLLQSHYI